MTPVTGGNEWAYVIRRAKCGCVTQGCTPTGDSVLCVNAMAAEAVPAPSLVRAFDRLSMIM